jgi:S-adenosyl-L-methionine hydrolase (adenosine-forming)
MQSASCFALLTDFGNEDGYAGMVRGVLSCLAPSMPILDISHTVPAGDIRRAALILFEVLPHFPQGTIFLAVVDPGVGSARLPVIHQCDRCSIVCPDNGIASFAMFRSLNWQTVSITNPRFLPIEISQTFHGRDIFAPAAGHLAHGVSLDMFGPPVQSLSTLPSPILSGNMREGWEGEVMYHDHFGNAITSIGSFREDGTMLNPWIPGSAQPVESHSGWRIKLADGAILPLLQFYSEAGPRGNLTAIIGSGGWLELAAKDARACDWPTLKVGARIRISISD